MLPVIYNKKLDKKIPKDAVLVDRTTIYGNQYKIGIHGNRKEVVQKYKEDLKKKPYLVELVKEELKGKDLICWCYPKLCHASVLLEIANET